MPPNPNGYKISMAEFKGRTLAHLQDIKEDIHSINGEMKEMRVDLSKKACKTDMANLSRRVDNIKLTSAVIGAIGGVISGVGAFFGLKARG